MRFQTIQVQAEGHVATVTLARDAVTEQMAAELRDACARLDQEDDTWVIILAGGERAFCLGTDYGTLMAGTPASIAQALRRLRVADSVAAIQKPVIAAMGGDAIDQGLELALACDIRVASAGARLGLTQVSAGLMPWDGGTQRLPRIVGTSRAMEMVLTSRPVTAQEALEMGLVTRLAPQGQDALQCARELAAVIASHGPIAARYLKEAVLKGMDMSLEQGLRLEADLNFLLQSTSDRAEGIRSFLERRRPTYRGQ